MTSAGRDLISHFVPQTTFDRRYLISFIYSHFADILLQITSAGRNLIPFVHSHFADILPTKAGSCLLPEFSRNDQIHSKRKHSALTSADHLFNLMPCSVLRVKAFQPSYCFIELHSNTIKISAAIALPVCITYLTEHCWHDYVSLPQPTQHPANERLQLLASRSTLPTRK